MLILSIAGTFVQDTDFANNEHKSAPAVNMNFLENPNDGRRYYLELLITLDKLILNKKKIWGVFLLCFSVPRNVAILFYDTEKNHKVGFLRILKVVGVVWVCFDFTIFVGLETYPLNFYDYAQLTTDFWGTIQLSGFIFGFGMIFFYEGF